MDVTPKQRVHERAIPSSCSLYASASRATFADAFTTTVPSSTLTATELFIAIGRETPYWVNRLMVLRNHIAKLLGLKDLGTLAALDKASMQTLKHGQRIGIFTFVGATRDELIVQDDDKHLLVQLALIKRNLNASLDELTLCTVVHTRNKLGRLYMLPVGPAHKRIVPAVLRAAPAAVAKAIAQQTAATITL
jgi:hypothetical protein